METLTDVMTHDVPPYYDPWHDDEEGKPTLPVTGSLSVLNVGTGDIEVSFNAEAKDEVANAETMIADMLARGYAIMVKLPDGTYQRAKQFRREDRCYIVVVPDDVLPELPPDVEPLPEKQQKRKPGRPRKSTAVAMPVKSTHAVGIARSAGG